MDDVERFVRDRNVARFIEQLETEPDLRTRATIGRLLIEEEDRYAALAERLDKVDNHIAKGKIRLGSLERLADRIGASGENTKLLANCREILSLLESYRSTLMEALGRSRI